MPLSETPLEQLRLYWRRSRPSGWLFPGRSPCTAWFRAGRCPSRGNGIRPRAPICFLCARSRGMFGAALSVACVKRSTTDGLPKGFMRIRHFGFLANRCRRHRLAQIRTESKAKAAETTERTQAEETPDRPCPKCRRGRLRVVGEIPPKAWTGGYLSG